jgi:predicted amidophosphoribosyltransferase
MRIEWGSMRLEHYIKQICSNCKRDFETTNTEHTICPLCRMDDDSILAYNIQQKVTKSISELKVESSK